MEQQVKSKAVVKYSAVQVPANFARLQCNTDLNLPPSNWLTSSAESYGLQHVLSKSTGFSSFKMAHMFPDCMGEVDVVSDAENIKKLLKIPYSREAVSMMVHCIGKTLLIDEFDIHKHLLRTSESDWEWLRKFFFEQVLQTLGDKDVGISTLKHKSRYSLQQRALVSKFLHYSLAEPDLTSEPIVEPPSENQDQEETLTKTWPPLPEPRLEEELPDPATDHTFNRNVVWTFEDIQMLLGTDLPIFGGSTHPCISLKLRDMAKPINVLTGIDYWLDNLMCNVPEVAMCYHLDGIVQRYELIKTEDLPHMSDSKFSPNLIRDVAQNILSFLKSNATKAGHTYWLFKGKDEDIVKLYDLTSLCSKDLMEQGQNPFTVPVAMLLYRVARNMKHGDPSSLHPGTIRALLNNCLSLLPKEKYPQIVTSAHYMLSDLYLPLGVNPEFLRDESPLPDEDDNNLDTSPIKSICLSDVQQAPPLPQYVPPPPLVGSVKQRCQQALKHVVAGLQCLQFFDIAPLSNESEDSSKNKSNEKSEPEPEMAQPFQPIPMPYTSLSSDSKQETEAKKPSNSKKRNKKKKMHLQHKKDANEEGGKNVTSDLEIQEETGLDQYPVYFWNSGGNGALSKKPQAMALPTWQSPETMDNASWKGHLKTLLYEKACLVYNTLAEAEYTEKRYGRSLRHVRSVLHCHAHMARACGRCTSLVSGMLGRAGDNCFHIAQDWERIDTHLADYNDCSLTDNALEAEMALDTPAVDYPYECMIIPSSLDSTEQLLLSSCSCYHQALMLKPSDALRSRIGNVHNELSVIYMNKITSMDMAKTENKTTKSQLETLLTLAQHHLDLGRTEFARIGHSYNLALLLSNAGRLMRMQALYRCDPRRPGLQPAERRYYIKAISLYREGLGVLGSRKNGPQVWDVIMWELSTTLYTMATLYQENPPAITDKSHEEVERELIDLLSKALQSCDLETTDFRQCMYQYRAAMLHYRLGSLYQHMYRTKQLEPIKRKHILRLGNVHYDKSALLMQGLEHPLEYLRLQIERVALQEFIAENSSGIGKLNALQTALDFLIGCRPVLESITEKRKAEVKAGKTANKDNEASNVEESSAVNEEESLLLLFESRIQFILKSLVKFSLTNSNQKISALASKFKEIYSLVLKQKEGYSLAHHLTDAVSAIEELRRHYDV